MSFKTVGLVGKSAHAGAKQSFNALLKFLHHRDCRILVEERIADNLYGAPFETLTLEKIGLQADLVIAVGGDGNMLRAARVLAKHEVAVIGVNRGKLGFLTDINPDEIERQLSGIFDGNWISEQRFLLQIDVLQQGQSQTSNIAVNEVVLHHAKVAHMMEFEVYIDDTFVFSQRSDGLIVATPTGSTAYSLSGGGPILTPNLDALTLVPMFPHTLSSRPIVVDASSEIRLVVSHDNSEQVQVSCDSHTLLDLQPGDEIKISKCADRLSLVHPKNYNYFDVLQTKLGWGSKLY